MKNITIMIYAGMGKTFGISPEIIESLSHSYVIREEIPSVPESIMIRLRQTSYAPEMRQNRRDFLRRCQERNGYCKHTEMPYHGLERASNREFRNYVKTRRAEKEERIQKAFSREINNKTHNKRHH
jgi:hypothetical protein